MSRDVIHVVNGVTRERFEAALVQTADGMSPKDRWVVLCAIEAGWLNLCFEADALETLEVRPAPEPEEPEELAPSSLDAIGCRHLTRLDAILNRLEAATARPVSTRCDTRSPHPSHGWVNGTEVKFQCPGVPS